MPLSLLTLNLHGFQEPDPSWCFRQVAQYIETHRIDVIALQEVSQRCREAPCEGMCYPDNALMQIVNYLNRHGESYQAQWCFSHKSYQHYEEGVAILSRYPLLETEQRYVSHSADPSYSHSRAILRARLEYRGQSLDVYSCHLGWYDDLQEPFLDQWRRLSDWVNEHQGPALLLGDFNNDAHSAGYDAIIERGFVDGFILGSGEPGYTVTKAIDGWRENRRQLRLDYLFANVTPKVKDAKVLFADPMVSDHLGVRFDLEL